MISVHSLDAIRGIAADKRVLTFATLDLKIAITDSTLTYAMTIQIDSLYNGNFITYTSLNLSRLLPPHLG